MIVDRIIHDKMESSSCLMCGLIIRHSETSIPPKFESAKKLLETLCKLFEVTSVGEDEWNCMKSLPQQLCCVECLEVLRNVQRIHEQFLRIERELKSYLIQVQTLLVKSEESLIENLLQSTNWVKFRKKIIKRIIGATPHIARNIKEEGSVGRTDDDNHDYDLAPDNDFVQAELGANVDNDPLINCGTFKNVTVTLINQLPRRRRKRKIVVIAEEDELDPIEGSSGEGWKHTRAAKQCAANALKCYIPSDNDDNDRDENYVDVPSDKESDIDNYTRSPVPIENDNNDTNEGDVTNKHVIAKINHDNPSVEVAEGNVPKPKKKKYGRRKGDPPKLSGSGSFWPLVVVADNLLMFKFGTFVAWGYTHLSCKAYKCKFQTEFDYYSSFQLIKQHINDNHRKAKHRQQISHPCVLCNTLFRNQFEFRIHFNAEHRPIIDSKTARGICECCLVHKSVKALRVHQFSHKNVAEKAYAREIGDGNSRCLQLSEREQTERNYKCDWENCTAAFKSTRNLNRHRQSHLPKEQRSDCAVCPECGDLLLKESVERHLERMHHPETVMNVKICPICDKRFHPDDIKQYDWHMQGHRGNKDFLCSECGAAFSGAQSLALHIKYVHDETGPFPCQWCDKIYTKSHSLRRHVDSRHADVRPSAKRRSKFYYGEQDKNKGKPFIGPIQKFPCTICDLICAHKFSLKKHMRRHERFDGGNGTTSSASNKPQVRAASKKEGKHRSRMEPSCDSSSYSEFNTAANTGYHHISANANMTWTSHTGNLDTAHMIQRFYQ